MLRRPLTQDPYVSVIKVRMALLWIGNISMLTHYLTAILGQTGSN
jgi:hypothetical protein